MQKTDDIHPAKSGIPARGSQNMQMLRRQPDMKIAALSTESGFANETTFFRVFKALTGMTPREWIAQNG